MFRVEKSLQDSCPKECRKVVMTMLDSSHLTCCSLLGSSWKEWGRDSTDWSVRGSTDHTRDWTTTFDQSRGKERERKRERSM